MTKILVFGCFGALCAVIMVFFFLLAQPWEAAMQSWQRYGPCPEYLQALANRNVCMNVALLFLAFGLVFGVFTLVSVFLEVLSRCQRTQRRSVVAADTDDDYHVDESYSIGSY